MDSDTVATISRAGNDWPRGGLPPWTYGHAELNALETGVLFRPAWLCVGHVSEIPHPGMWMTLDLRGDRALVIRGNDTVVRGFHNLCRHRGVRLLDGTHGRTRGAIVCPFHGWSYGTDGSLRGIADPSGFPPVDKAAFGLKPLDLDIWHGLIFIRFSGDGPTVNELLGPAETEIATYRMAEMEPLGSFFEVTLPVDWKAALDVDNEGYHVPTGHPGLEQIYGDDYRDEAITPAVNRSWGALNTRPATQWSVRHYLTLLPEVAHLPPRNRRAWLYWGLFPSFVITCYPDFCKYYQFRPGLDPDTVTIRGHNFALPDDRREMRAARWLNLRINEKTRAEDRHLMRLSREAYRSSAFEDLLLGDQERGVRIYHDWLRNLLPVLTLTQPPAAGTLAETNRAMLADREAQPNQ